MEFNELIEKRRAIRNFEDKAVSIDLINEIIELGCLAPNARNDQIWRFVIIMNKRMIKRISDESKRNLIEKSAANPDFYANRYIEALKNEKFNVFYDTPCLILILGQKDAHSLEVDCALAASYIMLAAANKGLGSNWIGLGSMIEDPNLKKELGISPDLKLVAPIIVGYPKQIPAIPERKAPQILKIVS
jgi:nitroreductase